MGDKIMAIFKCKMCGGTIEFEQGSTVGTCEYCGTKQTLPKLDDDKKANLYDRANHFRRSNDFDKAMAIYEQILSEDNTDAESYWSLVLCRYGIEYVEDPSTHKRIPTVNRAQYTSVFADEDYRSALRYADGYQKEIYEQEAKAIDEIQKGILAISQKEEPFDIFICYKETDANGRRTMDSVLATDLYNELTKEGLKVFFARITLEDKLGAAYEPYIFSALNSAEVMVVLGTKPENFNAVWVKNEWSRYLALIRKGAKKTLIPAYRDMDAYDLPEEFAHLQAQDMSKLGFMQDLTRGIKKILGKDNKEAARASASNSQPVNALLKRVYLFIEDGDWRSAGEYCEKALDIAPENAEAYLCKLMITNKIADRSELARLDAPIENDTNYQKALRFGSPELCRELEAYNQAILSRNEEARLAGLYNEAEAFKSKANYAAAIEKFSALGDYRDCAQRVEECKTLLEEQKAEEKRLADMKAQEIQKRKKKIKKISMIAAAVIAAALVVWSVVMPAVFVFSAKSALKKDEYDKARELFADAYCYGLLPDFMGAKQMAYTGVYLEQARDLFDADNFDEAVVYYKKGENEEIIPSVYYAKGLYQFENTEYLEAVESFTDADGYSDSEEQIKNAYFEAGTVALSEERATDAMTYFGKAQDKSMVHEATVLYAEQLFEQKEYLAALEQYNAVNNKDKVLECRYLAGKDYFDAGEYKKAAEQFDNVKNYQDGQELAQKSWYLFASNSLTKNLKADAYTELVGVLEQLGDYENSPELIKEARYKQGLANVKDKKYPEAVRCFERAGDYEDSADKRHDAMYQYVQRNKERKNTSTYAYLQELTEIKYEDTKEIFKELYAWKVDIIANDNEDNETTDMQYISKYSNWYFHIKLTGGTPDGKTQLSYNGYFPDGSVHRNKWSGDWGENYSGCCWFWYNTPAYGRQGTFTLKIYDGNSNLIGEKSVQITA